LRKAFCQEALANSFDQVLMVDSISSGANCLAKVVCEGTMEVAIDICIDRRLIAATAGKQNVIHPSIAHGN
jgi:hypothetical protein